MKKALKVIGLLLVVLIVAVVFVVSFKLGGVIKTAVERVGPKTLGVDVTLAEAFVRPISGKASLSGLEIGNPEGFNSEHLFKLSDVKVDMNMKSISSDTIEINQILIDGPEITYEKSLKSSNIKKLLENLQSGSTEDKPQEKPEEAEAEAEAEEGGKQVVIKDFIIRNAKVKFSMKMIGNMSTPPAPLTIGEIHLKDLGGELGGGEIAAEVLAALIKGIGETILSSKDVLGDAAGMLSDGLLDGVQGVGKAVSAVGNVVGDGAGTAIKSVTDNAGVAVDAVKGAGELGKQGVDAAGNVLKGAGKVTEKGADAVKGAGKALKGLGGLLKGKEEE